jgi:hypothetical protein
MEKSNLILKDNYEDKINIIMSQTIYSYNETIDKLNQHNNNHISVIKEYIGCENTKNKNSEITSVNQEIYKQIRKQMDITDYRDKNQLNINHIKQNMLEEEEKKHFRIKN